MASTMEWGNLRIKEGGKVPKVIGIKCEINSGWEIGAKPLQ